MYVYEALAATLARQGVECIFGLIGSDIAKLVAACDESGIDFYAARHENQAVAMADGYSRATDRVSIALVAAGAGFTNSLTAINTASRHGSKVIVVAGNLASGARALSGVDVCRAIGIKAYEPVTSDDLMRDVGLAFRDAERHVTTVLNLSSSLLDSDWKSQEVSLPQDGQSAADLGPKPKVESIANVADFLETTWMVSRPVVLAGRGAILSDAGPALQRLAERIGALLCTTLRAPALFGSDPYNLGISGTFSTGVASKFLAEADCVLAFGASLNKFTTYGNRLFPKAKIVQVDVDERVFGRYVEVERELAIRADARLAAEAILSELEDRGHSAVGYRSSTVVQEIADFNPTESYLDVSRPGAIDPRTLAHRFDEMLPKHRIVVIDGSRNAGYWTSHLSVQAPADFIATNSFGGAGSIGLSTGAAIGASIGRTGDLVVACMGDAGHLMSIGDLETAVRYRLPILFLVANDQALGAEVHYLSFFGLPTATAEMATPSFAAVASAMGAEGFTVSSLSDLDAVEERLSLSINGPIVVDCHIDRDVQMEAASVLWGNLSGG